MFSALLPESQISLIPQPLMNAIAIVTRLRMGRSGEAPTLGLCSHTPFVLMKLATAIAVIVLQSLTFSWS